jgi:very-short-patch-repair endonuclease
MRVSTQGVRELRHQQTEAEKEAWHLLRDHRLGLKFRRQYPIENDVVDFYCSELRLAVELDGGIHSQPSQMRKDAAKDAFLQNLGIRVLRLPNGLVTEDPEGFVRKVREAVEAARGMGRNSK